MHACRQISETDRRTGKHHAKSLKETRANADEEAEDQLIVFTTGGLLHNNSIFHLTAPAILPCT